MNEWRRSKSMPWPFLICLLKLIFKIYSKAKLNSLIFLLNLIFKIYFQSKIKLLFVLAKFFPYSLDLQNRRVMLMCKGKTMTMMLVIIYSWNCHHWRVSCAMESEECWALDRLDHMIVEGTGLVAYILALLMEYQIVTYSMCPCFARIFSTHYIVLETPLIKLKRPITLCWRLP